MLWMPELTEDGREISDDKGSFTARCVVVTSKEEVEDYENQGQAPDSSDLSIGSQVHTLTHILTTKSKTAFTHFSPSNGPTRPTLLGAWSDSMVNPVGPADTEKLWAVVLLYEFDIAFPASLMA